MRVKAMILCFMMVAFASTALAQDGLYVRFSLGPGFMNESSTINGSGLTLPTKNHALGWRFNDDYALFISDFGGLIHKDVGEYKNINLDALGPGFTFSTPLDMDMSVAIGYGTASFAESWKEAMGDTKGEGIAVNLFLDKKWVLSNRWDVGFSPMVCLLKTSNDDYMFINASLNLFVDFYLFPGH